MMRCDGCLRPRGVAGTPDCEYKHLHAGNPEGNAFEERDFVRVKGFRDVSIVVGVPDGRTTGLYTLRGPRSDDLCGAYPDQLERVDYREILREMNPGA